MATSIDSEFKQKAADALPLMELMSDSINNDALSTVSGWHDFKMAMGVLKRESYQPEGTLGRAIREVQTMTDDDFVSKFKAFQSFTEYLKKMNC